MSDGPCRTMLADPVALQQSNSFGPQGGRDESFDLLRMGGEVS